MLFRFVILIIQKLPNIRYHANARTQRFIIEAARRILHRVFEKCIERFFHQASRRDVKKTSLE